MFRRRAGFSHFGVFFERKAARQPRKRITGSTSTPNLGQIRCIYASSVIMGPKTAASRAKLECGERPQIDQNRAEKSGILPLDLRIRFLLTRFSALPAR